MIRGAAAALFLAFILSAAASAQNGTTAYAGMRLLTGTGAPVSDGVLIVRDGKVVAAGPSTTVKVPADAKRLWLTGKTVMPGLVSAHGHVGDTQGLEGNHYSAANVERDLRLYADYGVTTVFSLGGDQAAGFAARDAQRSPTLDRARIYVAGPVLSPSTPDEARKQVDEVAAMKANIVKIRVDDNLGTTPKMKP